MKYRTTAKQIRQADGVKIAIGYCDGAELFRYHSPTAYTAGVYGWNCDIYEFFHNGEKIYISTLPANYSIFIYAIGGEVLARG